jgi:ketosteroid isomerase-like protein
MAANNIGIVKELYGARDRGDMQTLLAGMTPDVEWHSGGLLEDHPAFGPRKGHAKVQEFFQTVGETFEFSEFSPLEFYSDKDKVFVLGRYAMKAKQTGKSFASDFIHVFTLRDGRVANFREMTDTARLVAACC